MLHEQVDAWLGIGWRKDSSSAHPHAISHSGTLHLLTPSLPNSNIAARGWSRFDGEGELRETE